MQQARQRFHRTFARILAGRCRRGITQTTTKVALAFALFSALLGQVRAHRMNDRWNLIQVKPRMLLSVAYPSREDALNAAVDLPHGIGDDTSFFVEGPAGQRIEQHDIDLMRFIPPDKAALA